MAECECPERFSHSRSIVLCVSDAEFSRTAHVKPSQKSAGFFTMDAVSKTWTGWPIVDDEKLYLGIDYGGNAVKMGLVDANGQLTAHASKPAGDLTGKAACRAFALEASEFVHGMGIYSSELGGVGVAIPGIVEHGRYLTPNVKADWSLVIDSLKQTFTKSNVMVLNDANAAALGELWMGAAAEAHSALLVTLGSGIGSGLVVDGTVVTGDNGAAGEVGHLTVVPDGRPCKCGRKGCVERYASARGIVQTFRESDESGEFDEGTLGDREPSNDTDALAVFDAAREGDPRALKAISVMADKLGFALAQVSCVVDPAAILLGGGLSAGSDLYIEDLRKAFAAYCFPACAGTEIRCATLLGDAGIIGAARYAMRQAPRDKSQRDWLDPDFGL